MAASDCSEEAQTVPMELNAADYAPADLQSQIMERETSASASHFDNPLLVQLAKQGDENEEKMTRFKEEITYLERQTIKQRKRTEACAKSNFELRKSIHQVREENDDLYNTINDIIKELNSAYEKLKEATTKQDNHMQDVKRNLKRNLKRKLDQMVEETMQPSAGYVKAESDNP
ncbi:hypothetical protein IWX90DRAFT_417308 [Phyllosticta citrichinensis]|uniref:Uncharacterized protein n=1 Tax=Phyllosticta citrichinensis TaxID=1130410 RepID=A0ABR1XKL5_9PEZI